MTPGGAFRAPPFPMNRAARRRAEKAAKKQAKVTPEIRARIVEKHWRDVWHFNDLELTVRDKRTDQVIASYPGV